MVEIKWIVKINITCLFFLIVAPNKFNYTSVTCIMFLLDSTAKKTVNNDFTLLMYAFIVSKIYCKLLSLALSRTLHFPDVQTPASGNSKSQNCVTGGSDSDPTAKKRKEELRRKGEGREEGRRRKEEGTEKCRPPPSSKIFVCGEGKGLRQKEDGFQTS